MFVARESRVEDERRRDGLGDLLPEGNKAKHLVVGFAAADVRVGVEDELGVAVLGEQGEGALDALAARANPVLVEDGLVAPVRHGMEVQVDGARRVESEVLARFGYAALQAVDGWSVERVGVRRHRGAFGQDVEPGKDAESTVEAVVVGVAESLVVLGGRGFWMDRPIWSFAQARGATGQPEGPDRFEARHRYAVQAHPLLRPRQHCVYPSATHSRQTKRALPRSHRQAHELLVRARSQS